jgi:NAD(P)H dehydrogenase (quinone)
LLEQRYFRCINTGDCIMSNVKVAIVYSSGAGHTRLVAEHIATGVAATEGASADLLEIHGGQIGSDGRWHDDALMAKLDEADAIVFGGPTYMGSVAGIFKLFLEAAFMPRWLHQGWKDKLAGGFTNSASRSGDKMIALQQLSVFAAQMGMIWVGVGDPPGGNRTDSTADDVNHLGSWLGLMSQSPASAEGDETKGFASDGDLLTSERFGRRVARTAMRWAIGAKAYPSLPLAESEARRRDQTGLAEWRKFDD